MNCPSRNDSPISHPEWNQSPHPLTPDLTTNQDLNGLVNARSRSATRGSANGDDANDPNGRGNPRLIAGRAGVGGMSGGEQRRAGGDQGVRIGEDKGGDCAVRDASDDIDDDTADHDGIEVVTSATSTTEMESHRHNQKHPVNVTTLSPPHPHPAQIESDRAINEKEEEKPDSKLEGEITAAEVVEPARVYGHHFNGGNKIQSIKSRFKRLLPTPTRFGTPFQTSFAPPPSSPGPNEAPPPEGFVGYVLYAIRVIIKFARFIGPGFIVAVSYIDPGNYATAVQAGAEAQYRLLFMTLVSNIIAIFLQSLCVKLGTVTGLNLAEMCRLHLPRWFTWFLYILAECAIIATDVSEVVGAVVAWNLLCGIPLVAGCFITLAEVFLTLFFYRPNGSMLILRVFEYFVMALVLGVVVCFCIQLSMIKNSTAGQVFLGYVPSHWIIDGNGVYLSCGILGATVMPHSLFLGSGIVQSRLKDFDVKHHYIDEKTEFGSIGGEDVKYRPSLHAIKSCLKYSISELAICLFTFALFVNSAILIVAGSFLFQNDKAGDADLFGIYNLMHQQISLGAATTFAIALLLSGISAGMVCTISGQFISEGMLQWKLKPWIRRVMTRGISVIPAVIISAAVGRRGMNTTLTACQVVLSAILPFVSAPLLYFTGRNKFMTVRTNEAGTRTFPLPAPNGIGNGNGNGSPGANGTTATTTAVDDSGRVMSVRQNSSGSYETEYDDDTTLNAGDGTRYVGMRNHPLVSLVAFLLWLVIVVMNIANIVLVGLGKA